MFSAKKLVVFALLSFPFLVNGASEISNIDNPSFEFSTPSSYGPFDAPKDWNCLNYTEVVSIFRPEDYPPGSEGNYNYWKVDFLEPVSGEYFLLLSTGHLEDKPKYQLSYSSQSVEFEAGTKLSGYYFFGTYDYPTYYDRGAVELIPQQVNGGGSGDKIVIVSKNVSEVGKYSSMEGWEYFEYTFDNENEGLYELRVEVNDVGDGIFNSYFAVDDLKICPSEASGNLNNDCVVNFFDFVILAQHWFESCSGLTWCEERDGIVDYEELRNMSQNWLGGDYSDICPTVKEGNFNCDCRVDFADVARLCRNWLKDCDDVEWCTEGVINSAHLERVSNNWLAGHSID